MLDYLVYIRMHTERIAEALKEKDFKTALESASSIEALSSEIQNDIYRKAKDEYGKRKNLH